MNNLARPVILFLTAFTLAWLIMPRLNGYLAARTDPDVIFPDNSRYHGEFRNGLLHGKGSLVAADGSSYTGDFVDGLYHGYGELTYNTGEHYAGNFKEGVVNGQGILTTTDNMRYEGELTNGAVTGVGKLTSQDGASYVGEVVNWRYQGKGKYTDAKGNIYEGSFDNGSFTGEGTVIRNNGGRYEGRFIKWVLQGEGSFKESDGTNYTGEFKDFLYHGNGELTSSNGDIYVGEFKSGYKHGKGVLTFAKPENGIEEQKGKWTYGTFDDPKQKKRNKRKREIAEQSLYNQQKKLTSELSSLQPGQPGNIEMFFLGLGGDGSQQVFKRELAFVHDKVNQIFNVGNRSIMLLNTLYPDDLPLATGYAFKQALSRVAEQMNKDEDIFFLYLTSHGTKKHSIYINQPGISLEDISLPVIKQSLAASGIKWKIIVVSACYSGGYVDALKGSNTLILTASAKNRQSFGCSDESELTYFAKALFREALTTETTFEEAFEKAQTLIVEWEKNEKIKPSSDPQIAMGESMRNYLNQFRRGLRVAKTDGADHTTTPQTSSIKK